MALQANGVANPEPRKRCLKELERLVQNEHQKRHMILLNMDANEDIQANQDLHQFCIDTNLVDLIQHFSPNQVNTPTYSRGKKRIDYSLCSLELVE